MSRVRLEALMLAGCAVLTFAAGAMGAARPTPPEFDLLHWR